jgi:hypothetical protein
MILKLRAKRMGGHVHCSLFVGPHVEGLALSGTLVFRVDEWPAFESMVERGSGFVRDLTALIEVTS